jgi:hypothetical protein
LIEAGAALLEFAFESVECSLEELATVSLASVDVL